MRSIIVVSLFSFVCLVAAGCQSPAPDSFKEVSAATSVQDVVNAWNHNCAQANFLAVNSSPSTTLALAYTGSNIQMDLDRQLQAMQIELDTICRPPADPDDLLSAVLTDPAWFK